MKIMKAQYVGEDRKERSVKSAMNFFKFLYYVFIVSVTYYVIKDLDCLPV